MESIGMIIVMSILNHLHWIY